jgi:hypothetical protein
LFNIPCPTCGVTRAMLSLALFDISGYLHYHPLAAPLIVAVLLMIHIKHLKHKWAAYSFVMIVLAINLCIYFVRLL